MKLAIAFALGCALLPGCKRDMDKRCKEVTEQAFGMVAEQAGKGVDALCATTTDATLDCMIGAADMAAYDACTRVAGIQVNTDASKPPGRDDRCAKARANAMKVALAAVEPMRERTFAVCKKGGEPVAKCLKHAPSVDELGKCLAGAKSE